MTKLLISAAIAAIVSTAAFTAPASAESVGFSINTGGGSYHGDNYRRHDGYNSGYRQGYGYRSAPAVRVYSGRSSYRSDDCYTKRTVKWRHGNKIVKETRVCN